MTDVRPRRTPCCGRIPASVRGHLPCLRRCAMLADLLLAPIPDLHLAELTLDPQSVTLHLAATTPTAACPLCAQAATRVHSHYVRHPADLPWAGQTIRYLLRVRRFFCDDPHCARRIFAERFGPALRV